MLLGRRSAGQHRPVEGLGRIEVSELLGGEPGVCQASWSLALFGASMLLAAVFRADPVDGFPVGTPEGMPTTVSTSGLLHFVAGGIGFIALAVSCFALAAVMSRSGERSLSRLSFLAGLGVVVGFFGGMALPSLGSLGIWFSVVVGWLWLALTSLYLLRRTSRLADASRAGGGLQAEY